MVGAVDARRVVDEIGVDAAALGRVGDAPELGQPEVGPLADDLAAERFGVDPQRVVRPVAGVGVGLAFGLDVGADAAEPQQIDLGLEQRADQRRRRDLGFAQAEAGADLGREGQRLRPAVEDPPAR